MHLIKTVEWKNDKVVLLDQRELPLHEIYKSYDDYLSVAQAIESYVVRGAPAVGVTAAFGIALGALSTGTHDMHLFTQKVLSICERFLETRAGNINLLWAINRMKHCLLKQQKKTVVELAELLKQEALKLAEEELHAGYQLGQYGHTLLEHGDTILTQGNAGCLSTPGFGSALALVYTAQEHDKVIHVVVSETRPQLQGAQLTAWELQKHGMNVTVITDNFAANIMRSGKINKVLVGADRIAANGDVVTNVGGYALAVLAKYHRIPFYVVAPLSTVDLNLSSGTHLPIAERATREVTHVKNIQIAPNHVNASNPSCEVISHELITAIVTEKGIVEAPYQSNFPKIF